METENLQEQETFPQTTLSEHLTPEQLAILARIVSTNTQPILDEVPPFSQDVLEQFRQMHR
ncbi:hypothetical protein [Candidatus Pantoea floridensis]|uniref:Uncharacterized protein n=1 Tax=Candidatus Pantoea floridensis TaxID=1938870 RepID=A0A286DS72_9GAMM|nr:hypothetical protein [Pantoea floridensis]PIF06853.1 hypothetical protein BX596_5152 [Enterobacteriaceae bacterium JKS000233]SOD61499.1 hypothetical protein SAMN06273570_5165 [Pantoea floridensis]